MADVDDAEHDATNASSKTVGYRFNPGYQQFYFTAYQGTATGYAVDNGSTGAQGSNQVNFE